MFTSYQDKTELITGLFLDYGKNAKANESVINNYVANLSHIDYDELKDLVDHVKRNSDKFPKWMDIDALYHSNRILNKDESVECNQCNRSGMILGLKCGSTMIRSVNFPNENNEKYYTTTIGRCGCENGNQYKSFPEVVSPEFIREFAEQIEDYPNVAASQLCTQLNRGMYGTKNNSI